MVASTDSDGVTTLMAYNSRGEQTISAIDLNANGQIDFGTDTVSFSEAVPALNTGNPVIRSLQKVWQPGDTNPAAGTVVSITDSAPDGLASTSTQLGVANPATSLTTLGTGGNMIQTQVSPDGSYTVSTIFAGRPEVTAYYNSANVLVASTAARDASNTPGSGYDPLGRPTHQYDSRTGVTTTTYLSTTADVVASTTDPGNRTTSFSYDVRGRQTTIDAPDTLDASSALLTNITTTSYFPDGQVQEVNGGQTYRVSHTYDYADRQKTLTTYGATPAVTTWTYSPTRGFLTRKEYADGKGTNYTYTPAGRLATRAWARGVTTTYSYDAGGRLTLTDYSDTTRDVALSYDALGRKITESQTNRTQYSFTYNPVTLAPTSETLAYDLNADGTPDFTRVLDRGQDSLQRDSGWQLKDGATIENQVTYAYDPAGRLASVTSPAGPFTYAYQANSVGLLSSVTSPAHTVTNTWENTRDVLARKQNAVGASVISAYDYSVNPLGQRTEVAKTGSAFASNRSIAWGYDSLGQVVKADSTAGFNRAYQYDGIGNRKKAADSLTLPATDNYTANALNQYTAVDTINPAYDDDGNATAYPLPAHLSANSTLAWDAENRLVSATVNGTTTTYLYDSGSRRIAQTTGSATTVYIYDAWNPVAEYTGTTLAKTYTWGLDLSGSMQGAGGVGGLLAVTEGTTSHFPTYDGNGNISEYLDSAGATVAHYEYDPFGRTTVSTGTKWGDFAHRFSTKPIDFSTGLYYYGYRFYDPATGRWPSRDPIEERGGANLYGFVRNNGVATWDYLGFLEAGDLMDPATFLHLSDESKKEWADSFRRKYGDMIAASAKKSCVPKKLLAGIIANEMQDWDSADGTAMDGHRGGGVGVAQISLSTAEKRRLTPSAKQDPYRAFGLKERYREAIDEELRDTRKNIDAAAQLLQHYMLSVCDRQNTREPGKMRFGRGFFLEFAPYDAANDLSYYCCIPQKCDKIVEMDVPVGVLKMMTAAWQSDGIFDGKDPISETGSYRDAYIHSTNSVLNVMPIIDDLVN
jgi:RHS repeat-associated protein